MDDNINEIIKKNTPPSNINMKNYNKQEELKILNEVMELDNLTESEKNYVYQRYMIYPIKIMIMKKLKNNKKMKLSIQEYNI